MGINEGIDGTKSDKHLVLVYPMAGPTEVWLGVRKKAPWEGCFSGPGGGVNRMDGDEFIAGIREMLEEGRFSSSSMFMEKRAEFSVMREGKEPQILKVLIAKKVYGYPLATSEMVGWGKFPIQNLPLNVMVPGDGHEDWVKRLIMGEKFRGVIRRSADAELFLGMDIETCQGF